MKRYGAPVGARALLFALFLLGACGASFALVRESGIEGRPGISFRNIVYQWKSLTVEIINSTAANVDFAATMTFVNRYGEPVAKAEILPQRLKRRSTRRCLGNFILGSGEEAQGAARLVWEFSPHRPQ